jgi:putative chitinase
MADAKESLASSIKSKIGGVAAKNVVPGSRNDSNVLLKIIGKNFMAIPGLARDLNVARQNAQKLVKIEGGTAATKADAHFLKQSEREGALEAQTQEESEDKKPSLLAEKAKEKTKNAMKKLYETVSKSALIKKILGIVSLAAIGGLIFYAFKDSITEWAKSLWATVMEKATQLVEDVKNALFDTINGVIEGVKEKINFVIDKVAEFFKSIGEWIGDKINLVVEAIKEPLSFIRSTIDKIMNFVLAIPNAIKSGYEGAKRFLGLGVGSGNDRLKGPVSGSEDAPKPPPTPPSEADKAKPPAPASSTVPAEPPPKVPPPQVGTSATPAAPPSSSQTKPVRVASESGKKAMIKAMDDYKVTDPTARAAIMAQVGHESGGFSVLSENMNYRPPTLLKIFPKYFKTKEDAEQTAAAGPEAIANRVYGGRMGNAPDEGFLFRGRGFIQLTGRHNYTKFGYASNPDAVATPEAGADTAMKYMMQYKGDWGDITRVTRFVNGGTIGMEDRVKKFQQFLNDPEITQVGAVSTATSGGSVSSASGEVASGQRHQAKPQQPVIISSTTVNNTVVNQNNNSAPAKKETPTSDRLASRVA